MSQTSPVQRVFWVQVLGEGAQETVSKMPEKSHRCGAGGQVCVAWAGHWVPPSAPDVLPPPGDCNLLSPSPSPGFLHGKALGSLPSPIPSFCRSFPLPFLPSVVTHGLGCMEEVLGVRTALHMAPSGWGHQEPGGGREVHREHGSMKPWGCAPLHLPSEAMPESPQHVATPVCGCPQQ